MVVMHSDTPSSQIFDIARQRNNRERRSAILADKPDADFLSDLMADDIVARLEMVTRPITKAVIIGNCPAPLYDWLAAKNAKIVTIDLADKSAGENHIICDGWDQLPPLPFAPDLIITVGVLDAANDVPGLLIQLRRALKPDGLFLASFLGAGSLPTLKRAMLVADKDQPRAHIHPQIDVRAGGDLLSRAGFTMPVADLDMLTVRYRSVRQLVQDIRSFGGGNALTAPIAPFGKQQWDLLAQHFAAQADKDGKTAETFALVSLSGWAPSPDQPKPARRGSATVSLASQLGKNKSG